MILTIGTILITMDGMALAIIIHGIIAPHTVSSGEVAVIQCQAVPADASPSIRSAERAKT